MFYSSLRAGLGPVLLGVLFVIPVHDGAAQYGNSVPVARMNQARTAASISGGTSARRVAGNASLSGVRTALSAFAADIGRMPTTAEGLEALIKRPPGARNWRGPYVTTTNMKAPFTDPWGLQYRYVQTPAGRGFIYTIASNGPDRTPGTRDDLQIQF